MGMSVGGGGDDGPMMEINTTPLIDVMLVLLIMIIMTIPIQTPVCSTLCSSPATCSLTLVRPR
jgi:biopolymer transport protein ExbD